MRSNMIIRLNGRGLFGRHHGRGRGRGRAARVDYVARAREARPFSILYAIDGVPSSHRLSRIALWWYWLAMAPWILWHALSSTAR